jgi:hypothetical protein
MVAPFSSSALCSSSNDTASWTSSLVSRVISDSRSWSVARISSSAVRSYWSWPCASSRAERSRWRGSPSVLEGDPLLLELSFCLLARDLLLEKATPPSQRATWPSPASRRSTFLASRAFYSA